MNKHPVLNNCFSFGCFIYKKNLTFCAFFLAHMQTPLTSSYSLVGSVHVSSLSVFAICCDYFWPIIFSKLFYYSTKFKLYRYHNFVQKNNSWPQPPLSCKIFHLFVFGYFCNARVSVLSVKAAGLPCIFMLPFVLFCTCCGAMV